MKITKKVIKEVEVLEDVLCNKCGESCVPKEARVADAEPWPYGLIEAGFSTGYFSKVLDGEYTFSVCEVCMQNFMETFSIPAKVNRSD